METPCIEWKGRKNAHGYGVILINGKQFFAHRLAVALSGRNIPKTKVCDHLCRNPACYNPDHLELVTSKENCLRGESMAARNARSNSCMWGHLYTPENTRVYTDKRGRKTRHCRHCYADRAYKSNRATGRARGLNKQPRFVYGKTK
jgi:hypothetical protein